eukprot:1147826-Pelagomonas_calceolata.AAC.2
MASGVAGFGFFTAAMALAVVSLCSGWTVPEVEEELYAGVQQACIEAYDPMPQNYRFTACDWSSEASGYTTARSRQSLPLGAHAQALILHRLSKAPAPAPKPKSGRPPSDLEPRYLPALEPPSPPSEAEDTGHIEQQHNMLPSSEDLDEEGYRSEVGEGQKGSRGIWSAATSRSPEEAGNEGEIIAEAPSEAPESLGDHGVGDSHGQAKKKDV